jgi:hypothetical protein
MPGILICMLHREIHPMFSVVVTACHVGGGEGWEEEYCSGKIIREIDQFSAAKTFIRLQGDYCTPRRAISPEMLAIHHSPYQSNLNPLCHRIWQVPSLGPF